MKIHFGVKHDTIRKVTVKCDYCGEDTTQTSKNERRNNNNFCDSSCYGSWRSNNILENAHPKYNRTDIDCQNCGNTVSVQKNKIKRNDNHFCDTECYISWMRNGINEDSLSYGSDWREIATTVRDRDGECHNCGITNQNCMNKYGCKLHVHHITPLKSFDELDRAHDLDNLISLCPTCHMKVEHGNSKI